MSEVIESNRRRLLAGVGPAIAAAAGLLGAAGAPGLAGDNADSELLRLIERFNDLQKSILRSYQTIVDDDERMTANEPLNDRQSDLLDQIIVLEAKTFEGVLARAKMVALFSPDFVEGKLCSDWLDYMLYSLVVDLVKLPEPTRFSYHSVP